MKVLFFPLQKDTTRRIYLIRNGEPAEFGGWRTNGAFRNHNALAKMDTSQTVVTVARTGGPDCYSDDPPLTQTGRAGAELVGRSLSERSLNIHTVYTSPSLRCLQTASAIISALNSRKPPRLRIEPALFEPLSFITRI
ncbi:unnamed protein product [Gongylonema pulchrum]|uniref:Phosphoglycerate mutase n=1 Tax=Gongylonema pulchrum TaxID=637853 RepID=A0A183D472_9BILA|nr:unnamed protein product [Gongylonema pulchrum]